jgi:hypothetical protein
MTVFFLSIVSLSVSLFAGGQVSEGVVKPHYVNAAAVASELIDMPLILQSAETGSKELGRILKSVRRINRFSLDEIRMGLALYAGTPLDLTKDLNNMKAYVAIRYVFDIPGENLIIRTSEAVRFPYKADTEIWPWAYKGRDLYIKAPADPPDRLYDPVSDFDRLREKYPQRRPKML